MKVSDLENDPEFPRKLLDKKSYVRLDPDSGEPELVRVEPHIEDGQFFPETVVLTIDDTEIIMERDMAQAFIESNGCVPLEEFSNWKKNVN